MPDAATLLAFALVSIGLVLTPGPNMIYLVSRSLAQGWQAGAVSLAGTLVGFLVFLVATALGLTALALAVPYVYEAIKLAGAAYLLWLAWGCVKPGAAPLFVARSLPPATARSLFFAGLFTNLLNPKVALFYASLLPQFVDTSRGDVLVQYLILGLVQIAISGIGDLLYVLGAGSVAGLLVRRPGFAVVQRWVMGTVLAGLAVRLALDRR